MNVYQFINSKAVRDYVEEIGYQFSAPEAAFLVHHSDGRTLEERIGAWQEIILTMPDCQLEKRNWVAATDSFHSVLTDYIELQRRKLEAFPMGEGYVYRYATYELSYDGLMDWNDQEDVFFSDYAACVDYCAKYELPESGIEKIRIYKGKLNTDTDDLDVNGAGGYIELSNQWEVLEVRTSLAYDEDKYTLDLDCIFDGLSFDFPTPFKRGDILTTHGHREWNDIPFVFSYITTWDAKEMLQRGFSADECPWNKGWDEYDKCREKLLAKGDLTDMHALGVIADQGKLYRDNILIVPTDLEYYTGELAGYNRQLKPLSLYEKGEISCELLVNSCLAIRAEEIAKEIRADCIRPYRWEIMKAVGL